MNWLMRLVGAPADLSERRQWADEHPVRASAIGSLLLAGVLNGLLLLRAGRLLLSLVMFVASSVFLFVLAYVNIKVRVRRSSRPSN